MHSEVHLTQSELLQLDKASRGPSSCLSCEGLKVVLFAYLDATTRKCQPATSQQGNAVFKKHTEGIYILRRYLTYSFFAISDCSYIGFG